MNSIYTGAVLVCRGRPETLTKSTKNLSVWFSGPVFWISAWFGLGGNLTAGVMFVPPACAVFLPSLPAFSCLSILNVGDEQKPDTGVILLTCRIRDPLLVNLFVLLWTQRWCKSCLFIPVRMTFCKKKNLKKWKEWKKKDKEKKRWKKGETLHCVSVVP